MSHTSRRKFLSTTGTLIAAAAAAPLAGVRPPRAEDAPVPTGHGGSGPRSSPANAWVANQPQYKSVTLYQFTPQLFQPLIGSTFEASDSKGRRVSLRLNAVTDMSQECHGSQAAFALQFQTISGKPLPQGTYQFYTPPLGEFLLFVVPSKPNKSTTYTAVINRL